MIGLGWVVAIGTGLVVGAAALLATVYLDDWFYVRRRDRWVRRRWRDRKRPKR